MIETWSARTPGGERVPGKWRAAALYALLTVALTYPLSVTPGSAVLAHYPDDELLMWVLAWDAHAFTHQPLSIFEANIFYPERRTLAYSENLIGNAFVAAPVIWSTNNPVLALNLVALLACALCGLGGYLLGVRVGLGMPGALVCGLIFAFSPPRFFRTPQIHLATVQWMPFALASLHAYQDGRRPRDLRIAIAFFTLQALASGHGAVFLACAIGLVLTYGVVLGEPLDLKQRVRDLGISGLLLLIPAILIFLPYRAVQGEMGLRRGPDVATATPASFLASPSHLHAWLLQFITSRDVLGEASAYLFVGCLPLALALVGILWARRPVPRAAGQTSPTVWTRIGLLLEVATLAGIVVASVVTVRGPVRMRLGPVSILSAKGALRAWITAALLAACRAAIRRRAPLDFASRTSVAFESARTWMAARRRDPAVFYFVLTLVCALLVISPVEGLERFGLWRFVYRLPGFSFIRAPTRFIVPAVLGIAVLAAIGLDRLTSSRPPRARQIAASLVGVMLVLEFAAVPLTVEPYRIDVPAVDRWVASRPKPFVVAEVPLVDPDQRFQTAYMLHSTAHWQKTVHGYSGILPPASETLFRELRSFPDARSIEHLKRLGVTYVIAHLDRFLPTERARFEEALGTYSAQLGLEYEDAAGQVYSLR